MRPPRFSRASSFAVAVAALLAGGSAQAADGSWISGIYGDTPDANWATPENWDSTPGSATANSDIATFNLDVGDGITAGLSTGNFVAIPSATHIGGITFTDTAGHYFIGANLSSPSLYVNNAGAIQILSAMTTNSTEIIRAPIVIEGGGAAYTFSNDSVLGVLSIKAVSGGTAGATTLTLSGSNAAANSVSGVISNGLATSVAVTKSGVGTWGLTANNTFTGQLTIGAGILQLASINDESAVGPLGSSSSAVIMGTTGGITGTLEYDAATGSSTKSFTLASGGSGAFSVVLSNGDLQLSGVVSGSGSLIKIGGGLLELQGANTYSGITSITAGTLNAGGAETAGTSGPFGSNNVAESIIFKGGTLQFTSGTNTYDYSGRLTTDSVNPYSIDTNGTTVTFGTGLSAVGTSGLTKIGMGTLLLQTASTFTGLTTVSDGTLKLGATNAIKSGNAVTVNEVTDGNTATLNLNGFNQTIGGAGLTLGGINTLSKATVTGTGSILTLSGGATALQYVATNNPAAATISATYVDLNASSQTFTIGDSTTTTSDITISSIIQNGALTKDGAGTMVLTGANTYTGATLVSAGVLNIQNATALGTTAGGTSVTSGAALQIQGGITVAAEALTLSGSGVSNTGGLRNISGDNVWQGTVTLGAVAPRINSDLGSLTFNTAANSITGSNKNLILGGASGGTVGGTITTGTGTLTKDGTGTWTLSGASTYSGATLVSAGVLNIQNATALGTTAGGTSVTSGAALQIQGGITVAEAALTINGTAVASESDTGALRNISGTNVWQGTVTLGSASRINSDAGTLTFSPAANSITGSGNNLILGGASGGTVGGTITTGAGTLTKDGAGTWILAGANTYTGATLISGGTLQIGSGLTTGALSTSSIITDNGTLAFNRSNALTQGTDFYSVITGTGGNVIQAGGGTTTLGNSNTYSGVTTISAGKLSVATLAAGGQTSSIGNSSNAAANLVLDGGTLQYTGTDVSTDRGFTITAGKAGIIEVTSNKLTISGASAATSGSLTKTGSGTLELTAVNGYTGGTLVSAGTLKVNNNPNSGSGTGSGAVSIAGGATLMGTGKIGGNLTVDNNGTLSPGNSPGILSVAGDVTLSSGSIFKWELSDNTIIQTGTSPSTYDQVAMTGALSVSGATINLVFNSTGSTVNFTDTFWNSSHSWAVFTGFTGSTGTGFSTITATSDSQIPSNLDTVNHPLGNFWYNTSNGTINWAVPEPSNVLAGLLLGAGLLRRRRDVKF